MYYVSTEQHIKCGGLVQKGSESLTSMIPGLDAVLNQ